MSKLFSARKKDDFVRHSATGTPNFSVFGTYSSGRCLCLRRSCNWHFSHSVACTTWCLLTPLVSSSSLPRTRYTCGRHGCCRINTKFTDALVRLSEEPPVGSA